MEIGCRIALRACSDPRVQDLTDLDRAENDLFLRSVPERIRPTVSLAKNEDT